MKVRNAKEGSKAGSLTNIVRGPTPDEIQRVPLDLASIKRGRVRRLLPCGAVCTHATSCLLNKELSACMPVHHSLFNDS